MSPDLFQSTSAGEVRLMPTGYHAFIPSAPPVTTDYHAIALPLSAADAALSELSRLGRYLPNPHLLIRPYLRREATASTRIEGTQADLNDLFVDEVMPASTPPLSDVAEIRNYVHALELGRKKLGELPFAGRLVREVHALLLADVRGQERRPGEFARARIGSTEADPRTRFTSRPRPTSCGDASAIGNASSTCAA